MEKGGEVKEIIQGGNDNDGAAERTSEKTEVEGAEGVTEEEEVKKEVRETAEASVEVRATNFEARKDIKDRTGVKEETTDSEKVDDADKEPKVKQQEVEKVETTKTADLEERKRGKQDSVADVEGKEQGNKADVQEKQNVTDAEANGVEMTGVEQISEVKRVDVSEKGTGAVVEESTHVEEGKAGVGQPARVGSPHPPTIPPPLNDETESINSDPEFFNFEDFEVVDALEEEEEEEEDGSGDRTKPSSSQQRHWRRSRDSPQKDRSHGDSSRSRHRRERSRRDRDDARDPRDFRDKGSSSSRSSRTSSRHKDDRGHHTHLRDKRKEEERVSDRSRHRQKSPRRTHSKDDGRRRRSRSPRKDAFSSASKKDGPSFTSRRELSTSTSKKDASSSTPSSSASKNNTSSSTPKRESSSSTSRRDMSSSIPKKEPSLSSPKEETTSTTLKEETLSSVPKKEAPLSTSSSREEREAGGQSPNKPSNQGPPKSNSTGEREEHRGVDDVSMTQMEREAAIQFPNKPSNEDPSNSNSTIENQEQQRVEGVSLTPNDAAEEGKTVSENQDRGKMKITKEENVKKDEVRSEVNNTDVQTNDKTVEVKDKVNENSKNSQGNINSLVTSELSNIEVQKEKFGLNSTKCELHNLELKSGMELNQTSTGIQPHNKVEMHSKNSESDNKGQEPTPGESEVNSKGLPPQNSESETRGREEGAKTESKPQGTANNKPTPSQKTKGAEMKKLEVNKAEPLEIKEGKTEETLTPEATDNQEKGIATRTRRGRRRRPPVVAPRRSTRSRKKVDEAKEEVTKGTVDEVEFEESKEVEKVLTGESKNIQQKAADVGQITKEQGKEESAKNTFTSNSNRNLTAAEDINADNEGKSSVMQKEKEDRNTKREDKPDLTPQEDNQDIYLQTTRQEDTHTTQDQDKAGIEEGKTQSDKEDSQGHKNQGSMQDNPLQINQTEENELRATQLRIIEEKATVEKENEGLTCNKDGDRKDNTGSLKTGEDKRNKRPQDSEAESAEKKEKEQEELTSRKDDGDETEAKRNKRPRESEAESTKKKRKNVEGIVVSHEGEKVEEKSEHMERKKANEDTCKEKDIEAGVSSSRKGQKTKENNKQKEEEENNDNTSEGKIKEARAVMKGETKPPNELQRESSRKKLWRYSKVVVVGDARMSLLATPDIREQLKDVVQVVVVPHLTLEGLLDVVKKEVEKQQEECSRGILLLCLAGLHGTLVKLRVPDECQAAGHLDMQEMVCAVTDDSLDPKFSRSLIRIKKSVQEALGKGSQVLFFPVLPVDMANYNAIQAKQHFEATGHKLQQRADVGTLHHHPLQQYKEAVFKVNGTSYPSLNIVPFNLHSKSSCRRFTDEQLQDGFMPTLDLVERHILPQLQRAIRTATTLRFPQVVLVGDKWLGYMVTMQQAKGVEPCTFIPQEQLGLRSLTADSPVVKQLSGLSRALIFLTVSLADITPPASTPTSDSKEKAKCHLLHDLSEAMNQFVQEARRVEQLLGSVTHRCTIITTPIMPFDTLTVTKGKAGKVGLCRYCRQTIKVVKEKIAYFCRELSQGNHLPNWHLNSALQKFRDIQQGSTSSSKGGWKYRVGHQGCSIENRAVRGASTAWEYYLHCLQKLKRTPQSTTITSILQNPKHLSVLLPRDRETRRAHSKSGRDKDHSHSTHSTHSRRRRERSSSPPRSPALDEITSPASSPAPEGHSNRDLDSISSGDINFPQSPCPSSINSPENFMDSSPSHTSNSQDVHRPDQPQGQPPTQRPSPGKRVLSLDSKDRSPSPQRWASALDGLRASSYQRDSREGLPSTHRYPSPAPRLSRGRSRSRSRSKIRSISRRSRSRTRSRSPKENLRGRMLRTASPAWVPHSPNRPLYRRSPSRSRSPLQSLKSTSRGRRSASRGKSPVSRIRSISRGRRSVSRGRRSASRGRRSVSRGRRSISRGKRSISRGQRSISRGKRSMSRGRSISRGRGSTSRRSISRGRRSISRGKRSLSRGKRSISRGRRSISGGRRSISRSIRSLSRGKRSASRGRRSVSRGRSPIPRARRSYSRGRRSISRGRRSISRGRRSVTRGRSISRGRTSNSRGRRSISRGRRGRSNSREKHGIARFQSQQDAARENMIQDALTTLRSVHERECEMYRSNPTIHPDIGMEYVRFCDKKTQSILALGGDPTQYNVGEEWRVFWLKRMEEIFAESWRVKMNQCLDALEAHKKPSSPPRPHLKTGRTYSPSSSSSYSSDSSHSDSQLRKKRKRRRRSSSLEASKRKRKVHDARLSPPKSYPRSRPIERSPGVSERSERYEERSPEYPRGHMNKKQERNEDQEPEYLVTKILDMTRARQKEGNMKHKERRTPSPPENVERDGQGRRSLENHKEQVQKRQFSPPLMLQTIREAWDQNEAERQKEQSKRYYPSPPGISENKQKEQINRYYPSPPGMSENKQKELSNRYYPSSSGMSVEEEHVKARGSWRQSPSPPDHRTTHSDSQHTTKHSIRDFIPVDELLPDVRNVVETREVGKPVEEDGVKPPSIVRDLWLQLSGRKSLSMSSDSPEVTTRIEGRSLEPYKEHTGRQKSRARDHQAQQDDPLQEVRAREGQAQRDSPTHPGLPRDPDNFFSRRMSKESQEGYCSRRSDKQSITDIFKSFAADKPHSSTTAKPGHHEDEVSSTTVLEETTKIDIDVVNVLEVLTHLGDKLGALCAPLKLVHQRAEELRTSGTDPTVIMSDSDNKFLLQMIQEKLQGILKDGQLNIIKKVIVQEAEQRLSVLLEQQKQRSLLGDLSLSHLARRCLDMDAPTTVAYIREVLLCRGQAQPPQDHLMKLYMAVKAEQLKIVRDQHDDQAAAAAAAAFAEDLKPSKHSLIIGGRGSAGLPHATALVENLGRTSAGLPHTTIFAEDPKPPSHTRFSGVGGSVGSPHAAAFTEDPKPSSRTHFSGGSASTASSHVVTFADSLKPPSHTRYSGGSTSMVPPQAPALTPSPPCTESHTPTSRCDPLPWRGPQPRLEAPREAVRGTHKPQEPDRRWEMIDYAQETKTSSSGGSRPAPPPPTLACPVSRSSTSQSWPPLQSPHILETPSPSTTLSTTRSTAHPIAHSVAHSPGTLPQAAHREVMYRQRSPKYVSKKPIRITLPKHQPQKSFVGTYNPLGDDTDSEGY